MKSMLFRNSPCIRLTAFWAAVRAVSAWAGTEPVDAAPSHKTWPAASAKQAMRVCAKTVKIRWTP